MNKLLLLATILICLTIPGFSSGYPTRKPNLALVINAAYRDSAIKESIAANPKAGFKDLFDTKFVNGINISQLNPLAVNFVQDYVEIHSKRLNHMKSWGQPYFEIISN